MFHLTSETFERPEDLTRRADAAVLYVRSYLLIRTLVGLLGVLLPTVLFVVDWLFLRGDATVRGSLSAYYHSPARDLFVGVLCVTAVLLLTYLAGQTSTWDFWLSSTAGVSALGVALLPTQRPNLGESATRCGPGGQPDPAGCTPLQSAVGETAVATVHFTFAATFILALAALCFVFAERERRHGGPAMRVRFHRVCGSAILAAVAWIALGQVFPLTLAGFSPLYVGEVVSVYAFGASWLIKGYDLRRLVRR